MQKHQHSYSLSFTQYFHKWVRPTVLRTRIFNGLASQLTLLKPPPLCFHQVLYVVLWCAVFSTLHLYITVSDYWVLCLSVSLISIVLTTAVILILHCSNKEVSQLFRHASKASFDTSLTLN